MNDYWFEQHTAMSPKMTSPSLPPLFGTDKLWELEEDVSYLKYLYPDICTKITQQIEETCDRLEYDGSIMFDDYPDKTTLQNMAHSIHKTCMEKFPEIFPDTSPHIQELIEVLLYNEIIFRRRRYRNRKRLYF